MSNANRRIALAQAGPAGGRQELEQRLGVNVPSGWWPTAPLLKSLEAAGFAWVQIHTPPRSVLADDGRTVRHADALRRILDSTGLRLILHGPDDLRAGEPAQDAALDGWMRYAGRTRAEIVAYHGANFALADGGAAAARVHDRLACEESSLRARARTLERSAITLAIENLAPVWPGPPHLCHSPSYIHDLVIRLDSPRIRMPLDHDAPLMLEVHPPHRPEPLSLRTVTTELLVRRRLPVDGTRSVMTGDPRVRRALPLG